MKHLFLLPFFVALVLVTASCESDPITKTTTVDFENVTLIDSIWNGSDGSGKFVSQGITFNNSYNATWDTWSGFSCSSKKDNVTPGWVNQYSAMTGGGAGNSKQYALAYGSATIVCPADVNGKFFAQSAMLTNNAYTYYDMLNGSSFSKKFETNDWYKVTISGYLAGGVTKNVEYFLADFREGKSFISKSWEKVDISGLGEVDSIKFLLTSSDVGQYGMNTPAYFCIDNVKFTQEVEK